MTAPSFEPLVPAVTPRLPEAIQTPFPSQTPDAGNVDELVSGPVLSIEPRANGRIRVTLEDPFAKAWRIVVSGTGSLASDGFEIMVETGDVAPAVTATEISDGRTVGVTDLSPFGDPTVAVSSCDPVLGVCLDVDSFRFPRNGDGRLAVELRRLEGGAAMTVTGGTAGWPGEPFILGPWADTDAFPWDAGSAS